MIIGTKWELEMIITEFYEETKAIKTFDSSIDSLFHTCRDPSQAAAKDRDQQEKQQSDL